MMMASLQRAAIVIVVLEMLIHLSCEVSVVDTAQLDAQSP